MKWIGWIALMVLLGWAQAGGFRVLQADRLELRHEGDEEIIVLVGSPVIIERTATRTRVATRTPSEESSPEQSTNPDPSADDQEETQVVQPNLPTPPAGRQPPEEQASTGPEEVTERIEAERVIYERSRKRLQLLGKVRYDTADGERISAEQLELYLDDNSLEAEGVRIETGQILLTGPACSRYAGQILLENGYVTPCFGCGQETPDYAFRAREVVLYPGDRIIAYDAEVLLQETPVLRLPILLLNLAERRPLVEVGQSNQDGVFLRADLPYVGLGGMGFTLVRAYEKRGFGLGIDHTGLGVARERYKLLYLPPTSPGGLDLWSYDLLYSLESDGWKRNFTVKRLLGSDLTDVKVEVSSTSKDDPIIKFTYDPFIDHNAATAPPTRTQKLPEVELGFPKGVQGEVKLNGKFTVGHYYAQVNPLNRSAVALGRYIEATRTVVEHNFSWGIRPWTGANFGLDNRFRGLYYSTEERQIDWATSLSFSQTLGGLNLGLAVVRDYKEGETPFSFDLVSPRAQRNFNLNTNLSFRPVPTLALSAKLPYNLLEDDWGLLDTSLNFNPRPFSLSLSHSQDMEEGPRSSSINLNYAPNPFSLRATLSYDWRGNPNQKTGPSFSPLSITASYAVTGGSLSLQHSQDVNKDQARQTSLNSTFRQGSFNLSSQLGFAYDTSVLATALSLGESLHNLSWNGSFVLPDTLSTGDSNQALENSVQFKATYAYARTTSLALEGRYRWDKDTLEGGKLTFATRDVSPQSLLEFSSVFHLPEPADTRLYLSSSRLRSGLEITPIPTNQAEPPGVGLQGTLGFAENKDGRTTLSLDKFGPSFAFVGPDNTMVYFSALVTQSFRSDQTSALKPRFDLVVDRCCWAFSLTLDALKSEARVNFLYGAQSAQFLFTREEIIWPWLPGSN
jgi:hypothetical protein